MQVDVGNVNAGWTEGVVTVIKKVERPDGFFHPYISGQALRRYIRDTMKDILRDNQRNNTKLMMSPEEPGVDKKSPVVTIGDPRMYIDDDLFGFMRAIKRERGSKKKKQAAEPEATNMNSSETAETATTDVEQVVEVESTGTRKRTSPLRISPAFGIFKLNSDRDLGTRSAVEITQSAEAGGSIFETEITNNIFRSTLLLEIDRVGRWKGYETTNNKDKDGGELSEEERKDRVCIILESLKYLWGGGRQTRFLVDLTPQFIIYARMRCKVPIFLNSLNVEFDDGRYKIKTDAIKEIIKDYTNDIESLIIGTRTGQFVNSIDELNQIHPNIQITSVGHAIDSMITDIKNAKFY